MANVGERDGGGSVGKVIWHMTMSLERVSVEPVGQMTEFCFRVLK